MVKAYLMQVSPTFCPLKNEKRTRSTFILIFYVRNASLDKPEKNVLIQKRYYKKTHSRTTASYYTCVPFDWRTLVACHYQHHQPLYTHLWCCQLFTEHKPHQCTLLHADNWEETPSCPKQTNEIDCGVYTCSFTKQYLLDCNSPAAYEGGDFRKEMVGDLLELAASNKSCGDFRWLSGDAVGKRKDAEEMSEKAKLDMEVQSAGLRYRDLPTSKDGNCMSHAICDQLARLGLILNNLSELCSSVVQYPGDNPLTWDWTHLREFISYQAWERYLRRMSPEGAGGDWITLWGLVNMLNIDHEAEEYYHSLDNIFSFGWERGGSCRLHEEQVRCRKRLGGNLSEVLQGI